MSKPTLDYFTPVRPARRAPALGSLLLGLLACGLIAIPYILESRRALVSIPVAVLLAITGICTALDDEELERRFMSFTRFLGLAVCNLAVIAAVVTMILMAPFL